MKGLLRKQIIFEYSWRLALGIILILLIKFFPEIASMSLFFFLFSLFFFFLPGWSISRLLKFEIDDFWARFLVYFGLSLSFYIIVNLLAIFVGLNINSLIILYEILLPLFLIVSLIKDLLTETKFPPSISLKDIFTKDNLIYVIPIVIGLTIFIVINTKGADFNGDPYLHLSIIRKAVEGGALRPENLGFIKSANLNPSYAYPAWHILIALFAKITGLNIFTAWSKMLLPLVIFSFFSWYFFFKVLFVKKSFTVLALALFMIFTFNNATGYFFQRLAVPDSLSQFILFPLILALALKYIFDFRSSKRLLIPIAVFSLILLVIHAIHYFYFLMVLLAFGIIYAAIKFKDENYKQIILRTLYSIGAGAIPLAVLGIILELKSKFISKTLTTFSYAPFEEPNYGNFSKFEITFKYAYLAIPLIIVFVRKNPRLTFLLAMMLLTPLVYWTSLKIVLSHFLSSIFVGRLYGNVSLYFAVIALVLGAILLLLDEFWSKFSKAAIYLINSLLVLGLVMIVFLQFWTEAAFRFYRHYIYSYNNRIFIDQHAWTIFIIILLVAGLILLCQKYNPQMSDLAGKFKNIWGALILLTIIAFVFLSPTYQDLSKFLSFKTFFERQDFTSKAIFPQDLNYDLKVVEYLKEKLPAKSVILADPTAAKPIAMLTDQFMAYNLGSGIEKELNSVYLRATPPPQKKDILFSKYNIDYLFLRDPQNQDASYFLDNPSLYKLVYQGKVQIYQINKPKK